MSTLLAGRLLALYGSRRSANIFATSRFLQHSYAATAKAPCNRDPASGSSVIPAFRRAAQFGDRLAINDCYGDYTYRGLFRSSRQLATDICNIFNGVRNERIAFLCPNNATYVITQWACWMSGHIAVPLSPLHPPSLLEHHVRDCEAKLLITTAEFGETMKGLATNTGRQLLIIEDLLRQAAMRPPPPVEGEAAVAEALAGREAEENYEAGQEPEFYNESNAMIVYTSGTTGSPKGVVLSHLNIQAQVNAMTQAWEWTSKDIVLHALPLHHVHGIVNALLTPLCTGARCIMHDKFDAAQVWSALLAVRTKQADRPTVFTGVPSMYALLLHEYDKIFAGNPRMKEYVHAVCSDKIRLMLCGSSRLPPSIHERWLDVTGHKLLERYGMTETGMILSNPLQGERRPGFVGTPLPSVEVRVAEPTGSSYAVLVKGSAAGSSLVVASGKPTTGELLVKGPSVFTEYFKKPKASRSSFTADGWFKTGDTCEYLDGSYRILGRTSVDIIKTGGYKVSALEIESSLLSHPDIEDCSVVGLPDMTWGHKVAVVVVAREGAELTLAAVRDWSKDHLASYAVPTVLKVVAAIPKNAMGKVNKKQIVRELFPEVPEVIE